MITISCPTCRRQVPSRARSCPGCGKALARREVGWLQKAQPGPLIVAVEQENVVGPVFNDVQIAFGRFSMADRMPIELTKQEDGHVQSLGQLL